MLTTATTTMPDDTTNYFTMCMGSLMIQPPKMHTKKGSGSIVYNELSQTLEYSETNQIVPFAINAQSAQFIVIIFMKNAAQMHVWCLMVVFVSRRALW